MSILKLNLVEFGTKSHDNVVYFLKNMSIMRSEQISVFQSGGWLKMLVAQGV